jgi:hypothetical protein
MKTRFYPLIVILLVFNSCKNTPAKSELDAFEGTWKLTTDNQYERWVKNPDGSFSTTVYSPNGSDTAVSERVKIHKEGEHWLFETLVNGQNNGKPIVFTSTIESDSLIQFENPAHDFPNIIHYSLLSPNTLRAFIAGKSDTIYFNYTRVLQIK